MQARIRGDGVAAYCCAHLLTQAGVAVALEPVVRARVPAILLGDQAVALIRDVFGMPDLFADAPRVRKRVVAWGAGAEPAEVEHSAIVVSEDSLLSSIPQPALAAASEAPGTAPWTIFASAPLPGRVSQHAFGMRTAMALEVTLREEAEAGACWIETVEGGWLFLVTNWLLAVGDSPERLLGESRIVAANIRNCGVAQGQFPVFTRIASPLGAPGWLACGSAAMGFDPICGDGTAHAIREAILAAAVIRAALEGGPAEDLVAHYQGRLTAGFRRHLASCRDFYRIGGTGSFWVAELAGIDRGIQWCDAALARHPAFRYQLRDFELVPLR